MSNYDQSVPTVPVGQVDALATIEATDAGAASLMVREKVEVETAILSAKRFPRNETSAYAKAIKAFERSRMAEAAQYSFPRGGHQITGPSVELARAVAAIWGNIRYGVRMVSADENWVHIRGYALDLETNAYAEAEDKFEKKVQRKNKSKGITEWVTPDERDLRELINKRGALLVRNAILQILPSDLVDECCDAASRTLADPKKGINREDRIKKMVLAFDRLGVTQGQLNDYLKHDVGQCDEKELSDLLGVYKAIIDGQANRDEFFVFEKSAVEKFTEADA